MTTIYSECGKGFVCFETGYEPDSIIVTMLYVEPEHRRNGIGSELLDMVKLQGKNIMLEVMPQIAREQPLKLEQLENFYLNNGFKFSRVSHSVMVWRPK